MTSALGQTALVTHKFIFGLQILSQILLGLPHNAEGRGPRPAQPVAVLTLPKQTCKGRRGQHSPESNNAARVLTVNNDLCLLAVPGANAGDIAAVGASVSDIDFVDTQDAHSLRGL